MSGSEKLNINRRGEPSVISFVMANILFPEKHILLRVQNYGKSGYKEKDRMKICYLFYPI